MEPLRYRCGDFHIDAANRRFTCRGAEVALEPRTFAVILQLLARPQSLVTRNELRRPAPRARSTAAGPYR